MEVRPGAVRFRVRVQACARQEGMDGFNPAGLRVRVREAPIQREANRALVSLLAARLQLPRASIKILAGARSRLKTVEVAGVDPPPLLARLRGLPE